MSADVNAAEMLKVILEFFKSFGLKDGIYVVTFLGGHWWIYSLYIGRLADRQAEINRIASDNKDLRDRFTTLLDRHFEYEPRSRRRTKS